ncbi:MAG: tetratricopeptide repeat protein [Salinibacter sp.]
MTQHRPPGPSADRSWWTGGLFLLLVGLLGLPPRPTHAQQADTTQLRRFQRANAYLQAGQDKKAIQLLKGLYEEAPRNTAFYRKLKKAYENLKRYDEALRLVEQRMGNTPTVALLSEKARLLYLKGDLQAANETWDRAVRLAPNQTQTYQTIYQTLVDLRHFRKAIDVLQKGRSTLEQPNAFRTQLAYLYGLDGQFAKAMQEYVQLLADAPQRVNYVQNRLRTFVEQGQGIAASIDVLQRTVRELPLNPAYRTLLAWLHMEQNNYAAAYDVYRALDRLQERQGQTLFSFAQKAADAQKFRVATRACESILERHPDAKVAPKSQKMLGDLYRQWASLETDSTTLAQDSMRYDEARSAYRTFLRTYPDHPKYPKTLLQLGTLQLDVYHALDEAQSTLEQLVSNHPQTSAADEGQYHLARIALFRGKMNRARLIFSRLAETAQESDLADRARFELGLLHFYQGEFDAAMARAKASSQNPSADVANDAIELRTLLQENRGSDSLDMALQIFARARFYKRKRAYQKALTALDSLQQAHPRHPLIDNAQFQRAEIQLARRDTAGALAAFRSLPKKHPRSPYADRSLFRLGKLLESDGRPASAVNVYNRLLTDYPKSLFAREARGRLRALQQVQG